MTRLYTLKETAALLGVSQTSLYRLMEEGRLAYYQVAGGRKISEEDLEAYIKSTRVPAKKEVVGA